MTVQLLLTIILVLLAVIFVVIIGIIVYQFGKKSMHNNPDKAIILVKDGSQVHPPYKGEIDKTGNSKKGITYAYASNKKTIVPKKYGEVYFKGRRLIFLGKLGQIIACPFDNDNELSDTEKADLIYEFIEGNVGGEAIKAMKGKGSSTLFSIMTIVVAFLVGIGVMLAVNQYQKQQPQQEQTTNPAPVKPPDNIQKY